jgi:hypothetical protein
MAILYFHKRLDTNQIFYVGIGSDDSRAYSKNRRNSPMWLHTANKHGYQVDIIETDLTWERACELEKLYIRILGRKDLGLGNLVNMTDGGDGVVGRVCTDETKRNISKAKIGVKTSPCTNNTKNKISEANKGRTRSEATKLKISESKKGTSCRAKECIDILSGVKYKSLTEACRELGLNYGSEKSAMRRGLATARFYFIG